MWWSSDGHTWGKRPEVPVLLEQLPEYHRANASSVIIIVFIYRDSVMEILFEQDNEEKSVATLILDTLVKVEMENESYRMDTCYFLIILMELFSIFGRRNTRNYFFFSIRRLITQFDVVWLPRQHRATVAYIEVLVHHWEPCQQSLINLCRSRSCSADVCSLPSDKNL